MAPRGSELDLKRIVSGGQTGADRAARTRWNVRDSDGTLILSRASGLTGGSAYTARAAERLGRPWLHAHPGADADRRIREWLEKARIETLNVAGPRASTDAEAYDYAMRVLESLLSEPL